MKITFIVPELNLTGGLRVVSIYARLLSESGHDVTVISPNKRLPTFKQKMRKILFGKNNYKNNYKDNFDGDFFTDAPYKVVVLDSYRSVIALDIADGDIVIATFWSTAEWIHQLPIEKGKKVYFIQHYEIHPWMPVDRVKKTLRFPFKMLVVAQWLADVLKLEYQKHTVSIIPNAVNHELFFADKRQKNNETVFGMMYSARSYKGSALALRAFNEVKKEYPEVRLIAFGLERVEELDECWSDIEYYSRPDQDKIREIYSECDAWLFTSSIEGFGLPILEAMACRTPVIGTRCGAAPELLKSGGGVLIEIDLHEQLLEAMIAIVVMEKNNWEEMSVLAFKEAQKYKWKTSAVTLEKTLQALL